MDFNRMATEHHERDIKHMTGGIWTNYWCIEIKRGRKAMEYAVRKSSVVKSPSRNINPDPK